MKIIIDVDPRDIDWGKSTVHQTRERGPDDAIYTDVEVDLDYCNWQGLRIVDFIDVDEACDWFHEEVTEGAAA
jgi:hypothetical protein